MFLTLERGFIRLHKAPGKNDKEFSRRLWRKVCSAANWHGGWKLWRMPATPDIAEALEREFELELPDEGRAWMRYEESARKAMRRANLMRKMSPDNLRGLLDSKGVRFKKEPFDHQVVCIVYLLANPRCALFLDTGTGKTYVGAVGVQALVDMGKLERVIVIAPKSILRVGWGADVEEFTDLSWVDISDPPAPDPATECPVCGKSFKKLVGKPHIKTHTDDLDKWYAEHPQTRPKGSWTKKERLELALKSDAQVFVINPEAFKNYVSELTEADWQMVIIDESTMLRSPTSQITNKMIEFGASAKRKVIMSGTPRPNDDLDLWGQMAFLEPGLWPSYYKYRDEFFESDFNGWNWRLRPGAQDEIRDVVFERALRYKLEDCVDLPGESYVDFEVEIEGEQLAHYRSMMRNWLVQLDDGDEVDTAYQLVQMNKLAQITSGFIYDDDKNTHYLGDNPKLKETIRLASNLIVNEDRSVVIWIRFPDVEGRALQDALKMFGVSTLHGGTRNREQSVKDFKSGKNKVMIAHPLSAKFGHTWTHCDVAIFFSYDYSWENYYQAKRRIYRIGQTRPVTYINVVARRTVDTIILKRLKEKEAASDKMIDRAELEAVL